MIANSRCIACNLSKKEEKIRKHSDEKKKKEFIQKVTGILYKYGDIESTPMLDKRIQDIYNEYYEEETDYVALKHKYNQYMLEREDEIKDWLDKCEEKIEGFVILDDGDYEWYRHGFDKHLVKTDFCTGGLRAEDADRAIRILNKKRLFSFFRKY